MCVCIKTVSHSRCLEALDCKAVTVATDGETGTETAELLHSTLEFDTPAIKSTVSTVKLMPPHSEKNGKWNSGKGLLSGDAGGGRGQWGGGAGKSRIPLEKLNLAKETRS